MASLAVYETKGVMRVKKTLIAVPCFDMVHSDFFESFVNLIKPEGSSWTMVRDTLINEARNIIAANAIKAEFDRVMWFDSDMKFEPDTLVRLAQDMDENNLDFVTGLYFTRRPPIKPCVFSELHWQKDENGHFDAGSEYFFNYPDGLSEISGSGFGCCLTTVDLLKRVGDTFGAPFAPLEGMGEDVSFCWRVIQIGAKMHIDTRVKCGHVGQYEYNENAMKFFGIGAEEKAKDFRRHMFNRCMALSHGETCNLCAYKDECTAERTLK